MKKNQSVKKGFTLIELIVVIAILGILAAVLLPKFSGFTDNARKKSAMSEAKACYSAMAAYYSDNGAYPTETNKTTALDTLSETLRNKMKISTTAPTTGEGTLFTYTSTEKVNGAFIVINVPENGNVPKVS